MKTLMRGAAVGLALALSAQVAQAQGGLSFGLGAGVVVPSGSMADLNSTGYTGQASLRMQPAAARSGSRWTASTPGSGCRMTSRATAR